MQAAAAIAATLIVTAPAVELPTRAPEPGAKIEKLPARSDVMIAGAPRISAGEGCMDRANNSQAFMDGTGVVYLYMSQSEQARRFDRLQTVYYPGDPGYALASYYAQQGVLCGGDRTVETRTVPSR